jgi:hypothetical protein
MAEIRPLKKPWQGAPCMGSIGLLADGLSGRRQVAGIRYSAFHFNFSYRIPSGTVVIRNPLFYEFFFSLVFDLGGNKAARTKNCLIKDTHVKDPYIASRGLTNDTIRNLKMSMGRMRQRIRSMAYSFVL